MAINYNKNNNNEVRFSLKLKLILYISLVVIVISGVFTWLFIDLMTDEIKEELEKRGLSEAISLGFDSKYGVLTEDSEILNQLIEGRRNKPDIIYVIISDNNGKVLASSLKDMVGETPDDEQTKRAVASEKPSIQLYTDGVLSMPGVNSKTFYDVSSPVLSTKVKQTESLNEGLGFFAPEGLEEESSLAAKNGEASNATTERLGMVRIGLSLDRTYKKINKIVLFITMVTISIIIVAIGISFIVAKITVAPLINMANVATQIAEGDLNKTVITKSKDEIGLMAHNFNRMAAKLKESFEGLETRVKERTKDLEEAGIKTQAIIQNMTDGLVALDSHRKIFLANKAFEKLKGGSGGEGKYIASISKDFDEIAKKTFKGKKTLITEVTMDEHIILKINSSLIIYDDTILGVLLIFRDITVEKEMDKMKTEFISNVSHELRTPLTSVLGFASNAAKFYKKDILPALPKDSKKLTKRAKLIEDNLSIIVSEGERLTRLINDVLDIAKMEEGKIKWNIQDVDIVDICQKSFSVVAGYPKSNQVKVVLKVPDHIPLIKGDQDRLIQVISNLMSNALKFTERGEVTLKVESCEHHAKISVIDTGPGIHKHNLTKVFEKFKQVGDILTGKAKGTGLGLPICKQIIEQLSGTIWAESEIDAGSSFCFTLGYSAKTAELVKPAIKSRIAEEVAQKISIKDRDKKPNILVVDDDPNIRKLLNQELEEEGYNVLEAENGAKAIALLKNQDCHVDLILLDIMMPEIDGYDVLSLIKTHKNLARIPVIIISAYQEESKVYRLGAQDFISKPIDQAQLTNSISSLLNNPEAKRVLIIDDDESVTNTIKSTLETKGYIASKAYTAEDGFKKAINEKPDIIIMDLSLPDIKNGIEMIKKIRLDGKTTNVHIILLADRMNENERRVAELLKVTISPDVPNLLENL